MEIRNQIDEYGNSFYVILDEHGNFFAKTYSSFNARKIAAVDELLEALQRAVSIIEELPYPANLAAAELNAAILKATSV